MLEKPCQQDILPRATVFSGNVSSIARALLPWVRRNPRFTLLCALEVAGLRLPEDIVVHQYLSWRMEDALRYLGCNPDGRTPLGARIWKYTESDLIRKRKLDEVSVEPLVTRDIDAPASDNLTNRVYGATPYTRVTARGLSEDASDALPLPAQVEVCKAWLAEYAQPTKTMVKRFTSDGLRRLVTEWTRRTGAYVDQEQLNVHTKVRYRSDRVYVTNGAFIAAALAAGYRAHRVPRSCDAWFNLSLSQRKLPVGTPRSPTQRLARFLSRLKPHFFTLANAVKVAGCAPHQVPALLRKLGCEHRVVLLKGRRGSLWWKTGVPTMTARRTPARLPTVIKWAQDKTSVTLREAAAAAGLTIPRGRAPADLVGTLRSLGFAPRRRRWVRL